jgi:hypothetical protein
MGINGGAALKPNAAGNIITVKFDGALANDGTAPYKLDPDNPMVFTQGPAVGQETGGLSANVRATALAANGSALNLAVDFPGELGLCGSFYSPLMVFFGEGRPKFTNVSEFPLRPEGKKFYWPEGSKDWAFLVFDKRGDGKITGPDQLFGSNGFKNGFDALKELDSNKDGVIDSKDKQWSKIKLWYDLNGNGIVDEGELKPLSFAGIDSLPLKYKGDHNINVAERAEFREYGVAMSGKKSFPMIDVWFGVHTHNINLEKAKKGEGAPYVARKTKT